MLNSLEYTNHLCLLCEEPSVIVPDGLTREERRVFLQQEYDKYKKCCDEVLLNCGYDLKRMRDCVEGKGSDTVLRFTEGMTVEQILEEFKRCNESS